MVSGLERAIETMIHRIADVLKQNMPSIYLYGSVVMGDFKLGWSDIDILVLTRERISQDQAEELMHLRQTLLVEEPGNLYFRSFEGGMLTLSCFLNQEPDKVVYWGTSGERITDRYDFDAFGMVQLLDSGILLYGTDIRDALHRPSYEDLQAGVRRHYESIRQYARITGRDLYSYGWLLDISRCLYTLRTGQIIAKTVAGDWALQENLCPCTSALKKAVAIRKDPLQYLEDEGIYDDAQVLGECIQTYADVLESFLKEKNG